MHSVGLTLSGVGTRVVGRCLHVFSHRTFIATRVIDGTCRNVNDRCRALLGTSKHRGRMFGGHIKGSEMVTAAIRK